MRSWNNLKDAGGMLPAWFVPLLLSGLTIGLYVVARFSAGDKPHELIAFASMLAIVSSLAVGFGFLVTSIVKAQAGNVLAAVSEGFHRGMTYVWVTSAVSLFVYVGAAPAYSLASDNLYYTLTTVAVLCLLAVGYWASGLKPKSASAVNAPSGVAGTALTLPTDFKPSDEQRAVFQVTMADESRLLIHQAARIIAYKGSNVLIKDSFSAFLDINARTAKIFTEMNLLSTSDMIFWRMHMLLIGTAAELLLGKTTSDAAIDDLQNFEDLAVKYLHITGKGNFYNPASQSEAILKSNRILMLRKSILQRCGAAVAENRSHLLELIKLMRGRPTLVYEDIKHILSRVQMPADFPKAEFDTDAAMEKTMIQLSHEQVDALDGESMELPEGTDEGEFSEPLPQNVHPLKAAKMDA